jgi:hypothetical protein
MASAWLVRSFIDPQAQFAFGALPAENGQIPFDMANVEFGHVDGGCTFETLVGRFGIEDAAARQIAQVVHDLDLKEAKFRLAETATIGRLVDGLRDAVADDHELLDSGVRLIDALARSYRHDRTVRRESTPAPRTSTGTSSRTRKQTAQKRRA